MIEYSVFLMTNYLKPEDGAKAYAKNQVREIWDLNKFLGCPVLCSSF